MCGKGCFHVSGERGVPAGGAGEYPEVLLDGEDHHKGRGGVSVRVWGEGESLPATRGKAAAGIYGVSESAGGVWGVVCEG